MRSFKTEGIIIKRRNIGEADRILTVLTQDRGKIIVKAVGVRRITSRRSSHAELLNFSTLSLHKGAGMPIVTEMQVKRNFQTIKEDLGKVGFAYHICELIDGLCAENQENEHVFNLLLQTLSQLSHAADNTAEIIHGFEVELLTTLGFWRVPAGVPVHVVNTQSIIENILERRLKTKQILPQLK